MAQHINIVLVDDIDGSEASETVSFALDGTNYEIDLTDTHALQLREAMSTYVKKGRRLSRRGTARKSSAGSQAPAADGPSAKVVREWAREGGYSVPDRGRIPAEVRQAYAAAH